MKINFETIMKFFGLAVAAGALSILVWFLASPKKIEGYYPRIGYGGTCIYASAQWYPDDMVTCTQDMSQAVELLKQLNETVK